MNKKLFHQLLETHSDNTDYEKYLNTTQLLTAQKKVADLLPDELQFQIVHQSEELWMKLLAYTLLQIDSYLVKENTNRVLTLFRRAHKIQRLMIDQLSMLETMSPKEYFPIRALLGNGSGQESPGFKILLQMPAPLWQTFKKHYLEKADLTIEQIYDTKYNHCDAYLIAEQLIEFDSNFQEFLYSHLRLVERTIGPRATSLKGRSTDALSISASRNFFPELWNIRTQMTEQWTRRRGSSPYQ